MASDDTTLPADDAPLTESESVPQTPQQAAIQRKYDANAALDQLYRKHAASLRDPSLRASVIREIYSRYEPKLMRIARRYRLLSPIFDEEDLRQEALFGLLQALRKYKNTPDGKMRFPTFTVWSTKNIYQRAIGSTDNLVEIYGPDGRFVKVLPYRRFVKQKKELEAAGYVANTKRRFCYLSDALRDEDLVAKLRESPAFIYDSEAADEREKPTEGREGGEEMKDDEEQGEPEADERTGPSIPGGDGLDFQMIDSLYRRWVGTRGKDPVTETDPVVLDVYGLLKGYGEKMVAPFRNNGSALTDDEVKQAILGAIIQGFGNHGGTALSEIPFSVSLRVAVKRSVERLHKDKQRRS